MPTNSQILMTLSFLETISEGFGADEPTIPFLRCLAEHAPTERGRRNICQDILSTQDDNHEITVSRLRSLAERYRTGLIIPMAAQGGRTPSVTEHPSRFPAEIDASVIGNLIQEAKLDSHTLRGLTLRRDNFRSLLSGKIDYKSYELEKVQLETPNDTTELTEVAHILPFSLSVGTKDRDTEIQRKAHVWEVISRFAGNDALIHDLNGQDINRLGNVLTLTATERNVFGRLKCWLEAIDGQPNTYCVAGRRAIPDPRLLEIHAACAKVAHASGMGEYIDSVLRDLEDLQVLPENGSSDALMFALNRVSVY
ncbi:hypothetical protein BN14_10659 [Rhizoctonia solani AG-1 IB]|uniref:HNH nuclease domain-containing protein n=1 Tax=Thanatephorus cucumeris (strain AG1-IB / isolate 7/3/14) TaxID=1108050 RepID=M5CGQ4_THACB|nr:hypothetical protein BN14_10659 [Rhizoctonia solani AG-1 IB]